MQCASSTVHTLQSLLRHPLQQLGAHSPAIRRCGRWGVSGEADGRVDSCTFKLQQGHDLCYRIWQLHGPPNCAADCHFTVRCLTSSALPLQISFSFVTTTVCSYTCCWEAFFLNHLLQYGRSKQLDPLQHLPVYLMLYPVLQWSIGSW